MKLSQRLDIVVLVLIILYVLTGCTTTDPTDLGACLKWTDIQVEDRKCTYPVVGGEVICVHYPYITSVCIDRESSN